MTAEPEGAVRTQPIARSIWLILTPSGNDAGWTLDRETAVRRARSIGGLVGEMIVIGDFREPE